MKRVLLAAVLAGAAIAGGAQAAEKLIFGTNWKAQAEHGGYYQAVADGIYARAGLEVEIRQGGPQVNQRQYLVAGKLDLAMGLNMFDALNYLRQDIPMVVVAAIFQKDPIVLISHAGQGLDSLAALKGKPILIAPIAKETFWQWLKVTYGYSDAQIRPYTFNPAPFLVDKQVSMQGFVTSEPFTVAQAGATPVVHLLADHGYRSYSTTIETSWKLVAEKPGLVQRFVNATIEGWIGYLHGDPAKANALIKSHNPEMTDAAIAYARKAMLRHGMVDSGDALRLGIGAMTNARWRAFHRFAVDAGLYPEGMDLSKAYTLQFVNQGHGLK